jgi:hypothetical protein
VEGTSIPNIHHNNYEQTNGPDYILDSRNTKIPSKPEEREILADKKSPTGSSDNIRCTQNRGSGKINGLTTDKDCSESSATTLTLVSCELQTSESVTMPSEGGLTRHIKGKEISSEDRVEGLPSDPAAVAPIPKYLSLQSGNLGEVPNARSPCPEDFDKFSDDSFFTESDSNSLIGGIIRDMVGV